MRRGERGKMEIKDIPYGHRNAVKRQPDDKGDRKVRQEIELANMTGDCIINVGNGYYRPDPEDPQDVMEFNEYLAKDRSRERSLRHKRHAMMQAFLRREQDGIQVDDPGEAGEPERPYPGRESE